MKKIYHIIICINYLLAICLVKGIALNDGTEHLDYLLQKQFCPEHQRKNYKGSLKTRVISNGSLPEKCSCNYLSVFSPNTGKYGPEKLRTRTLFTK